MSDDPERLAEPLTDEELAHAMQPLRALAKHGASSAPTLYQDQAQIIVAAFDALTTRLAAAEERAQLAEIERDTAQAQVRAKQSWIDGMKVDYDALNNEANDHAHAAAIAEARATRAEELLAFLAACTDELPVQFRQILAPFRIAPTEGNPE